MSPVTFARSSVLLAAALAVSACASQVASPSAPARPPTPQSVNRQQPGGDAKDPHRAALDRLLSEPWGTRSDKLDQLLAPIPDTDNWKRVRYRGFEHLVGFRYGKDYHAASALRVQEVPAGTPVKSETCMRAFEAWARPQIQGFDVKFGPFVTKFARWRDQPLVIQSVDGRVNWGFSTVEFSVAWTAYPAYPNACLIYGVGIKWDGHDERARRVRDRFVQEGFVTLQALTPEKPVRPGDPVPTPTPVEPQASR